MALYIENYKVRKDEMSIMELNEKNEEVSSKRNNKKSSSCLANYLASKNCNDINIVKKNNTVERKKEINNNSHTTTVNNKDNNTSEKRELSPLEHFISDSIIVCDLLEWFAGLM